MTNPSTTLSPAKKRFILWPYLLSQFVSIGCAFAGSSFGIYDYYHPDSRNPDHSITYGWLFGIFAVAVVAGGIGAFTSSQFQGEKIGAEEEEQPKVPRFPYDLAPRTLKSNFFEGGYLTFAATLSLANNYLLIAGLNAFFSNSPYAVLPPGWRGVVIFLVKSLCIDFPFDLTSSVFETCEEIKAYFTASTVRPLSSIALRFIARRPMLLKWALWWIQIPSVFIHTGTDISGLILSIPSLLSIIPGFPAVDTINDLLATPLLFWPLTVAAAVLLIFNCIQTCYFEAKESELNLQKYKKVNNYLLVNPDAPVSVLERYPIFKSIIQDGLLRFVLERQPVFKKIIRAGFYSQGVVHAFGDVMPVVLLLRDVFDRHPNVPAAFSTTFTLAASLFVFFASWAGTHYSEVITAIQHYNKEFQDIPEAGILPTWVEPCLQSAGRLLNQMSIFCTQATDWGNAEESGNTVSAHY